jgi:hypothetical protein
MIRYIIIYGPIDTNDFYNSLNDIWKDIKEYLLETHPPIGFYPFDSFYKKEVLDGMYRSALILLDKPTPLDTAMLFYGRFGVKREYKSNVKFSSQYKLDRDDFVRCHTNVRVPISYDRYLGQAYGVKHIIAKAYYTRGELYAIMTDKSDDE